MTDTYMPMSSIAVHDLMVHPRFPGDITDIHRVRGVVSAVDSWTGEICLRYERVAAQASGVVARGSMSFGPFPASYAPATRFIRPFSLLLRVADAPVSPDQFNDYEKPALAFLATPSAEVVTGLGGTLVVYDGRGWTLAYPGRQYLAENTWRFLSECS